MTPFVIRDCAYREIEGLIVKGEIYFSFRDILASLAYVQSKIKDKHTGWQWILLRQMPERFKFSITPKSGRTVDFINMAGVLWLESRVKGKARRKVARSIRADFYDWLYKTFPEEISRVKRDFVWNDEPWLKL